MVREKARQRFGRHLRLRRGRDFERIFQQSCRSSDKALTVLARRNEQRIARLGMAISGRHGGNAVQRNRLKRIIRESFRMHMDMLRGLDLVVVGRQGLRDIAPGSLSEGLVAHWREVVKRCGRCC